MKPALKNAEMPSSERLRKGYTQILAVNLLLDKYWVNQFSAKDSEYDFQVVSQRLMVVEQPCFLCF